MEHRSTSQNTKLRCPITVHTRVFDIERFESSGLNIMTAATLLYGYSLRRRRKGGR